MALSRHVSDILHSSLTRSRHDSDAQWRSRDPVSDPGITSFSISQFRTCRNNLFLSIIAKDTLVFEHKLIELECPSCSAFEAKFKLLQNMTSDQVYLA